jgi:hypothetical protein
MSPGESIGIASSFSNSERLIVGIEGDGPWHATWDRSVLHSQEFSTGANSPIFYIFFSPAAFRSILTKKIIQFTLRNFTSMRTLSLQISLNASPHPNDSLYSTLFIGQNFTGIPQHLTNSSSITKLSATQVTNSKHHINKLFTSSNPTRLHTTHFTVRNLR